MTKVHKKTATLATFPALSCLQKVAQETLKTIPSNMQEKAQKINIVVENYADAETLNSLRLEDKYELLGLYRGTPIPIKSIFNMGALPDSIFLYRCPLIRYAVENQECINKLVKQVMMHELGHHFGQPKLRSFYPDE